MTRESIRTSAMLFLVGGFLATQPGASCVDTTTTTNGQTTKEHHVDGSFGPSEDEKNDDPNYIPRRAVIVMEGKGELDYAADADGDAYVQDLHDERTVVTHRIHRGEKISVIPDMNRVKLDDDSIYKDDLKKDHVHRIYLLRDRRFDDGRDRDDHHDPRDNDRDDRRDDNRDLTPISINKKDRGPYNEVGVPKDARMMDQGMNREMTFVTSVSGTVYVFDVKHDCVVATPQIDARQVFKFSPGIDRIMIDDKKVGRYDFDPDSQYRIYFAR